jgi:hypothetical protein
VFPPGTRIDALGEGTEEKCLLEQEETLKSIPTEQHGKYLLEHEDMPERLPSWT